MWQPAFLPDVPPPKGAYSPAVRVGELVFVSGQVPRDVATGELVGDTVAEQTGQVMKNMELALQAAGGSLRSLVAVTVYLASTDHWAEFDATYREIMTAPYPTRTAVGAQLRGILVEISGVAVVR